MVEIINFVPKSKLTAEENLKQFISLCKDKLTVFGKDLDWQSNSWPKVVNFTKIGVHSRAWDEADVLDKTFIDFAKAYLRYQQGHKLTKTKNETKALRCIEGAFLLSGIKASIINLTPSIADKAAQLAREHYSREASYHAGKEIERLIKFVCEKRLIPINFVWKSPIPKPLDVRIQTGIKAKKEREKKLPDEDALLATAEVFNKYPNLSPRDIFSTSCIPILLSVPARINELLHLSIDCLVFDKDKNGNDVVGIRWYSGKGYGAEIKWVPEVMVEAVCEAIKRIKELTKEGRILAQWYEDNPDQFYRHVKCPDIDEDRLLSKSELALALNISDIGNLKTAVKNLCGREYADLEQVFNLRTLNECMHQALPEGFPWLDKERNLKWSQALFCMRQNEINDARPVSLTKLWIPSINLLNEDLGPKSNRKSLFARHGYDPAYKVTSHQPRHKLSTEAKRGGMSDLALAKWAGRADPKHNRYYNHMTEDEMVALAKSADRELTLYGPKGDFAVNMPTTMQEFHLMEKGIAHTTEFGYCIHDFIMSPCQKHRDCLNCSEQVCVKGHSEKLKRLLELRDLEKKQFEKAKQALESGDYGADRWYENKKRTLERVEELINIMTNDKIMDGALIRLKNDNEHTPLKRAISAKIADPISQNNLNERNEKLLGGDLG